ncbi:MAG: hypothetical protein AAFO73_11635, partial [Pseudomonadota bacterium]
MALTGYVEAVAQTPEYQTVRKFGVWNIGVAKYNGRYEYCYADIDNVNMTLRIATQRGRWNMAVPYYGSDDPFFGIQFGLNPREAVTFKNSRDGWAYLEGMQQSLRSSGSVSVEVNGRWQRWGLAGSSRAMDLARQCDRNGGRLNAVLRQPPRQQQNFGNQNAFFLPARGEVVYRNLGRSWRIMA